MSVELAKGTRVIPPEEALLREDVLGVIRQAFERYGFRPLETPMLQRFETLAAKYAGGAEILKEIFKVRDQGNRELALRYDLTVPLAVFMALNPTGKLPLKRYEIGKVFRDGPIKRGRVREFWQCDADIVGSPKMVADGECLQLVQDVFQQLGVKIKIKVNNIKILKAIMQACAIADVNGAILSLDKLEKMGKDIVVKELQAKGVAASAVDKLFAMVETKEVEKLQKLFPDEPGFAELKEVLQYGDAEFDPTLARGLSYYTGMIFEVFVVDAAVTSSVASGGRFDRMIGEFIGGKQEFPAVGLSFGLEPITEVLKEMKKEMKKTRTEVFVIPIQTEKEAMQLVRELRKEKVNAEVDVMGRSISKNMEYANSLGIPFVVFLGEDELKRKKYKLRDLKSGKEFLITAKEIVGRIEDARKVSY